MCLFGISALRFVLFCVQCHILNIFFTPWNICSICLKHGNTSIYCFVWIKRLLLTVEWRDQEVGSCILAWSWVDERQTLFQWAFCMSPGSSDSWSRVGLKKGSIFIHVNVVSFITHSHIEVTQFTSWDVKMQALTYLLSIYSLSLCVFLSLTVCLSFSFLRCADGHCL